ncbi:DUF922 domain-containing protein [Pontibacter ruber]|uniref:DUF922 domain-containing protein n=1 Tax=Pontibacter ruber TaxID=1343895 RepID=A0ABW5CTX7_9BACT|nr:hypothetical protein [Pontibacter ruber]
MKGILLLLFCLIVSTSGFCHVSDTLIYSPQRKLSWQDFKGTPNFSDRSKGAQIAVTINLRVKKVNFWTGKITYDAFAMAFRNELWVKDSYKDAYTLAHEQLHFDIAHIYAETLELELNTMKEPEEQKAKAEEMLIQVNKAMNDYQAFYDRETRGGNNIARQKEWATKIKKDLEVFN